MIHKEYPNKWHLRIWLTLLVWLGYDIRQFSESCSVIWLGSLHLEHIIVLLAVCFELSIYRGFSLCSSRDSKLALRAEVSDLEKQLASLEWKLDLLTAQATTITQGKKSRSSAKTRANGQLTGLDEKFAKRNLEVMFLAFVKLQNQYTTYTTMLPVLYSNSIISLFHLYYVLVSGFRTCHLAPSLLWMKAIWYI